MAKDVNVNVDKDKVESPILTLSQVLGMAISAGMDDPTTMTQSRQRLAEWYRVQTPANRQEFARQVRTQMERARLIAEGLFTDMLQIMMADL